MQSAESVSGRASGETEERRVSRENIRQHQQQLGNLHSRLRQREASRSDESRAAAAPPNANNSAASEAGILIQSSTAEELTVCESKGSSDLDLHQHYSSDTDVMKNGEGTRDYDKSGTQQCSERSQTTDHKTKSYDWKGEVLKTNRLARRLADYYVSRVDESNYQ